MFKEARIKLTAWYLLIIMGVSLSFSCAIYVGINRELTRIADFQRIRIQGIVRGFPTPLDVPLAPDLDAINEARFRIIITLGFINLSILVLSGLGGYFLAGQTLEPIGEMLEEQKEFVSNASHELRTPLTSLMTEIEVTLRDKGLSLGQARKLLESNLEEVRKMNDLSNYLLKLNRLQDGQIKDDFKTVDLKNVVERAVHKIGPIAKSKKVTISMNLLSTVVKGNMASLEELVTILLDNAIKYSTNGSKIELITKNRILKVKDTGIGISGKDIPHIFDRFYRADISRSKENSDGYGLGLSIAKSIVDAHNASIKVQSKFGKGTTFTVYF
jgi:signal transduction histidine kinase